MIEWALRPENNPLMPDQVEDVRDLVEAASLQWKPENAMRYLTEIAGPPPEQWLPTSLEMFRMEPRDLAVTLTFGLRDKMSATVPGFPVKKLAAYTFL